MRHVIRKTPLAEQDLIDHYVYIGERNRQAADRLLRRRTMRSTC